MNANPPTISTNNLNAVDIMKFLAAILVIFIHTNPLTPVSTFVNFGLVETISRIAVPFFFMTSGYLFYSKIAQKGRGRGVPLSGNYLVKYLKRISILYVIWSAVYFSYDIIKVYEIHPNVVVALVFYAKNLILIGGHFHLWYFPALIFGTIILYVGTRILPLKFIVLISWVMYIIGLFGDSYFGLISNGSFVASAYELYFKFFGTTRNGLFFGFMYITLGAVLFEKKSSLTASRSGCLFGVSFAALMLEVFLLRRFTVPRDYNMMLFLIPTAYFLLQFLINLKLPSWNMNYSWFRDSSVLIYCSHGIFLMVYTQMYTSYVHRNPSGIMFCVLVFLSSLALSLIIMRIRHYKKDKQIYETSL